MFTLLIVIVVAVVIAVSVGYVLFLIMKDDDGI
jgi:hypothetical protein